MAEADSATFSYEDGARAVGLAREAVETFVQNGARTNLGSMRESFYSRTGALVRLQSTRGRGSLRGCAGCHETVDHLGTVIVDQAIAAASAESCGSAVSPPELDNLTVSVALVSAVTEVSGATVDLSLGTETVVVPTEDGAEWLYPSIPLEQNWSQEEYIVRTLEKAGYSYRDFESGDLTLQVAETTIFTEETPAGTVIEA